MTDRLSLPEYKRLTSQMSVSATGRVVPVARKLQPNVNLQEAVTDGKSARVAKKPKKLSVGEETLAHHLGEASIPFEREHRFHPTRMWRFDFAFPVHKIGVEVEGGTWSNGRHSRGAGFEADAEKYNQAALYGWRVLTFTTGMVKRGEAVKMIRMVLDGHR